MTDSELLVDAYNAKLRADIIDGIVRTMIVTRTGIFEGPDCESRFTAYDIRAAVAMALALYTEPNLELIEKMNKLNECLFEEIYYD